MKNIVVILSIIFIASTTFIACSNNESTNNTVLYECPMHCEGEKTYTEQGSCPVCKMDLTAIVNNENTNEKTSPNEIDESSIFNLTSEWTNQHNETINLKDLKGDILVVVMIYTSCQAACPRLVADMRSIYNKVNNKNVKYVLVSIDPETDTPEKMNAFAKENQLDNEQWILLRSTVDDTREFSNVLAVKYKQISPIDFSHSNIISVFNKNGVLFHQQEGLGVDNEETVGKIMELTSSN